MTEEEKAEWLKALRKASRERDATAKAYTDAASRVRGLIVDANDAGVPMTEIARAAGIARVRAHRLYARTSLAR